MSAPACEGRRAIAVDAPHGIDAKKRRSLSQAECREAAAILDALHAKKLKRLDAIGHSAASLYLTAAALMDTERRFRALVLINPAGLKDKDNSFCLVGRCVADAVADMAMKMVRVSRTTRHPGESQEIGRFARLLARQLPVVCHLGLTLAEIRAIGNVRIGDRLRKLRQRGIRIIIIQTDDDRTFPPKKSSISPDCYDALLRMQGSHNGPIERPAFFMSAALKAIATLEEASSHGPRLRTSKPKK